MDFKKIKQQLIELRDELDELEDTNLASTETVVLDQSRVGRLSRMDALQAQAISSETRRRRQELRKRIEPALQRLANDDYGHCIDCDEMITEARIEYDPTCTLCIGCASKRELE